MEFICVYIERLKQEHRILIVIKLAILISCEIEFKKING